MLDLDTAQALLTIPSERRRCEDRTCGMLP